MSKQLPEQIEPLRLAEARRTLVGYVPIAKMKRLATLLDSRDTDTHQQDVNVELRFGVDEAGQANVTGRVQARVSLRCQRCMQSMPYLIEESISLGIVSTEQLAEQLPDYYEPLLLGDSVVLVSDLVEDELILALPSVALHDQDQCSATGELSFKADNNELAHGVVDAAQDKPNPFAVLEQLKTKKTS